LRIGAMGRLVSQVRCRLEPVDGVIPQDPLRVIAVLELELGERRTHPRAEGTVEICELDDRHRHPESGWEPRWTTTLAAKHHPSAGRKGIFELQSPPFVTSDVSLLMTLAEVIAVHKWSPLVLSRLASIRTYTCCPRRMV
jgi:hypothetical protein